MKIIPILLFAASIASIQAAVVFNIWQSGSDVLSTGTGSINTAGISKIGTTTFDPNVGPADRSVIVGGQASLDVYSRSFNFAPFGNGSRTFANTGTGNTFGFIGNNIYVPRNYVSDSQLAGTATYNSNTIASLGMTPGTYTLTWGSGANADSAQLIVGTAPIPEPSSLGLLALGAFGLVARRKR